MRGFFFGRARRNDPIEVNNPRPIADYGTGDYCSGDAGRDGYTVLAKADPSAQGSPPFVAGVKGPVFRGPDNSFEQ